MFPTVVVLGQGSCPGESVSSPADLLMSKICFSRTSGGETAGWRPVLSTGPCCWCLCAKPPPPEELCKTQKFTHQSKHGWNLCWTLACKTMSTQSYSAPFWTIMRTTPAAFYNRVILFQQTAVLLYVFHNSSQLTAKWEYKFINTERQQVSTTCMRVNAPTWERYPVDVVEAQQSQRHSRTEAGTPPCSSAAAPEGLS